MKVLILIFLYLGLGFWLVHMGLGWEDLNYWVIGAFAVAIGIVERSVGKESKDP